MVSLTEVLTALDLAKKGVPAIEALTEGLKTLSVSEASDVKNAVESVGKAVLDLKNGFLAVESAVKAAIKA